MTVDPMNNDTTSVGRSSTEQGLYADNPQGEILTENHTNSPEVDNVIEEMEKSQLNSTQWYISFFYSQSS
jgi:hypothetical protein